MVLVIVAIGAPWIAPYAPTAQDVNNMLAPPGAAHCSAPTISAATFSAG